MSDVPHAYQWQVRAADGALGEQVRVRVNAGAGLLGDVAIAIASHLPPNFLQAQMSIEQAETLVEYLNEAIAKAKSASLPPA